MEKRLIHFDEQKFIQQKNVFLSNLQILNQIASEYSQLGLGPIDVKRTQEILSGNMGDIVASLSVNVGKDAKNSLTRKVLRELVFERFEIFQAKVEHLAAKFEKNQHTVFGIVNTPRELFSIKKGIFEVPDSSWEKVKESCSNYIETTRGVKIYEALQAVAEANNKFIAALGPNVRMQFFPPQEPSDFLILNDNELFEPDPTTLYESLTQ